MKLYTSHRAPNPRRVRWVMAEKGIEDVEVIEVDILTGEHKTPEYRARVGVPPREAGNSRPTDSMESLVIKLK